MKEAYDEVIEFLVEMQQHWEHAAETDSIKRIRNTLAWAQFGLLLSRNEMIDLEEVKKECLNTLDISGVMDMTLLVRKLGSGKNVRISALLTYTTLCSRT
jgi:hypothetical protein